MAEIECWNCHTRWNLAQADTNICPHCGWVHEIWYGRGEAEKVAQIYNEQKPPLDRKAGVCKLVGMEGFSVSFPDPTRLAAVSGILLEQKH